MEAEVSQSKKNNVHKFWNTFKLVPQESKKVCVGKRAWKSMTDVPDG